MLDVTPMHLYEEIEASVRLRRQHDQQQEPIIKRIAGSDFRADWRVDEDNFEAHEYQFIRNTVPNWVFNNPVVDCEGLLPGVDDQFGESIKQGVNQWIPAVDFASIMTQIAVDTCIGFGVAMATCEPVPGYDQASEPVPLWPMVYRLANHRFFQDASGGRDQWRFRGHTWVRDKDDLEQAVNPDGSPMFDTSVLSGMAVECGLDDEERARYERRYRTDRNRVMGYEVFVRETGMIYSLAYCKTSGGTTGGYLRQPRRYIGSQTGPYRLFGTFFLPDQVYPLSPLAATASKVKELNAHRGQMSDDAGAAKTLLLVDKSKPENRAALESAPNGAIVGVDGLAGGMVQAVTTGGVNKANADYVELLRRDLHETGGMSANRRGEITGATASEVDTVEQADDARTSFDRSEFQKGMIGVLMEVATLMCKCDQVRFPVAIEDPMTGQPMAKMFQGGPSIDPATGQPAPGAEQQDNESFGRLRITIQPYSAERVDSNVKQRRAIQNATFLLQAAPVMNLTPWVNWEAVVQDLGESQNNKGLGARYLNAANLQGAQQQMVMQQQMAMMMESDPANQPQPGGPPAGPKGKPEHAGAPGGGGSNKK